MSKQVPGAQVGALGSVASAGSISHDALCISVRAMSADTLQIDMQ